MCGIVGVWNTQTHSAAIVRERAQRMADSLTHRGPDDDGVWVDQQAGLALGFRRLAIVDLSPNGHQPMCSPSGRYVMVFNGEVYNFGELRLQLEPLGHRFRGHSDTEVMLAAIEQWGVQAAVERFVGMFAFALWDRALGQLTLVRDRLGIKPLYYGWMGETFLCGSELKALRAHPSFKPNIDRGALALYVRHGYIPAPYTIYQNVYKLPPGCSLTLKAPTEQAEPVAYWSAKKVAEGGVAQPFTGTAAEAVDQLDTLLRTAVRMRMVADVPLGAFLSGGIDSSTVVALMQAQSQQPIKTFSIGFHEHGFDEAIHARAVAQHLGTDHTELYVTPAEAQAVIPHLPEMYDEPFADASQIPTYLVSRLARTQVTVSLSGDGGDELFAGYTRYQAVNRLWDSLCLLPLSLRSVVAQSILGDNGTRPRHWVASAPPLAQRLQRLAKLLPARQAQMLYHDFLSNWPNPTKVVLRSNEPATAFTDTAVHTTLDTMQQMMFIDLVTYLPDDILAKVDRASMAVSLEARVPLLDHRVVEFAWRLPLRYKLHNKQSKWILRQVLHRYVPPTLIERPKQGFNVPISDWLRGPLRTWAEDLLDERRLRNEGFFDPALIRACWKEHLDGQRDWSQFLWNIVMFQAWHATWGTQTATDTLAHIHTLI